MYILMVICLMLIFPTLSILIEGVFLHSTLGWVVIVARWFVFWMVGIRLFIAGARQALNPRFTAVDIFHFKSEEPLAVIRELGFANLALGITGMLSLFQTGWLFPVIAAGTVFYGLAGFAHVNQTDQSRNEKVALISDLFAFAVLLAGLVGLLLTTHPFA